MDSAQRQVLRSCPGTESEQIRRGRTVDDGCQSLCTAVDRQSHGGGGH